MIDLLNLFNDWDAQLLLAVNGMHNSFFDVFMYAYSGKLVWIPLYAALVYVLFRNLPWKIAGMCIVGVALTIVFADQIGASLIRPWAERLRPSNLDNPLSEYVHIVNGYRGGRYGFPSCHASNTFGLAFYLMFLIRRKGFTCFMMAWAVVTCYSRAYLGVHYPGDLLVGALLGLCGAALMYGLFVKVSHYRRTVKWKELWVPMAVGGLTVVGMLVYAIFKS